MQQTLIRNTLTFLLYLSTAKLGGLLSIPPDFSSPIWPAAGIATALTLIWSPKVLPAIFLAVIANHLLSGQFTLTFSDITFLIWMGLAPTLQAFVGYYLLHEINFNHHWLISFKNIRSFLIKVGPLTCLISSSLSILGLFLFDAITLNTIWFNWFTWWIGDMLGSLFIVPLIIVIAYKRDLTLTQKLNQIVIPTSVIFFLVVIIFSFNRNQQIQTIKELVTTQSKEIEFEIRKELELYRVYLKAISSFFSNSKIVTEAEFSNFSEQLLSQQNKVQAIEWIRTITPQHLVKYQIELSNQYQQQISIKNLEPTRYTENHHIVTYVYPYKSNQSIIGLDLGTEKNRAESILLALNTNKMTLTQPLIITQEMQSAKSFIAFIPTQFPNKSQNEQDILALVIGYNSLMNNAINRYFTQEQLKHYQIQITSKTKELLFSHLPAKNLKLNYTSEIIIEALGQEWHVSLGVQISDLINKKDWLSWLILAIGVFITAFVQIFFIWLTSQKSFIERQVKLKTEELSKAKLKAEQATLQKTYFLANMSHELRTPLNAIIGLSEMLKQTELNNNQKDYLRKITLASKTLLSLVSDILDVSKIETGNIELEQAPFSLNQLICRIDELFSDQMQEKGLSFQIRYSPLSKDLLIGDEHRIQQVIMNLCSNALKFTENGGVSLVINYQHCQFNKQTLQLTVEVIDTGIGIDKDRINAIFDAFTQADTSITRKYGGTGLGLNISQTFIRLMGGSLKCDSQIGIGSRFYFTINLTKANKQIERPSDAEETLKTNLEKMLQGQKVLVAEDNEINQQIILYQLENLGAQVTLANDGIEAVDAVRLQVFKLILMDIQMPNLDGIQATKQILTMPNGIQTPIVAMTANVSNYDKQSCFDAGMKAHIPKPFEVNKLYKTLLNVLK